METYKTEKDIYLALQGYWEAVDGNMGFQIYKHKLILNGGVSGIGIPGLDNLDGAPLLLKWHEDLGKWQIFCEPTGWLLVFLDQLTETTFSTVGYDTERGSFLEPTSYNRR